MVNRPCTRFLSPVLAPSYEQCLWSAQRTALWCCREHSEHWSFAIETTISVGLTVGRYESGVRTTEGEKAYLRRIGVAAR